MELYFWLTLANFKGLLEFLSILGFLISLGCFVLFVEEEKEYKKILWVFFVFILLFTSSCFIPSRADLAIMFGWDAIKSDNVQQVADLLINKIKP